MTQVKSAGLFDVQAFKELSLKIRKAAEDILHRDFDARGHRPLEKYLNAPDTSLLVGNRVLDKAQLGILAKGNALYLPPLLPAPAVLHGGLYTEQTAGIR